MSEQTASHLDPRLQRIAAQVRPGAVFADIGCDHGLLSIELVRQGAQKGYACDIKPGPLQAGSLKKPPFHRKGRLFSIIAGRYSWKWRKHRGKR